jgi:predicted nucleotidyltransferase
MASPTTSLELPPAIARVLDSLVAAARNGLGDDLRSVVLFGSAADGQLRATSDVNVIFVLVRFEAARIDGLRDAFRAAHAAAKLEPMFLLEREITAAVEAFAVKFADVLRRRRVIFGADPFAKVTLSRALEIGRLKQVLLNLALRLRERYVMSSLREEQAARIVADTAGPLRSFAAALLELEGRPAVSPKAALLTIAQTLPPPAGGEAAWNDVLGQLSSAREGRALPAGVAGATLLRQVDLTLALRARADGLG